MTYIVYVTVQSDCGRHLDEHGNPCSVAAKIWMIVANLLISQIYATHPMVVVIHNSSNPDMNLTTFSPDFVHVPLVLLVHSWYPIKTFFYIHHIVDCSDQKKSPLSIHLRSNVPNESTLQNSSLKLIWVSSISLTF